MAELRALALRPEGHRPHPLHGPDRVWPETNCYLDLWIELLHATGRDPLPLLGLGAALEWEGDHFTFLKPAAGELQALAGAVLQELALWDATEAQVATQLGRGAVVLLEVDAFFLPDTAGAAYRERHTKTTIAITAMDPAAGWVEYFHNAGMFRLAGEDYAGIFTPTLLFPYAELVRFIPPPPGAARDAARRLLARYAASRRGGNAVERFAADLPGLMAGMAGDPLRIHALCFNTARQFGGAVGLLADHLAWLGEDGSGAARLAALAKTLQFQVSRAARRRPDDPAVAATLRGMAAEWDRLLAGLPAPQNAAQPLAREKAF
jgi:hypothetical protein